MSDTTTQKCGAILSTGHGSSEGCILPAGHETEWHRGAPWPHGKAVEWRPLVTRTVIVDHARA